MARKRRPRISARERYIVRNMPPIWRRSLTESGMERETKIIDYVVVAIFVLVCLGAAAVLLLG